MKTPIIALVAMVTTFGLVSSGFPSVQNLSQSTDPYYRAQQYNDHIMMDHSLVASLTDYLHYLQVTDILHLQAVVAKLQREVATQNA